MNKMTKVLGLTGGIASGKTTVSNYLKSLGIDVIDADIIAREVMQAGEPVVLEIAEAFGNEMLLPNGEIDRQRLGESIFQSEIKREKLNQLVQGKIYREIMNQRNELLKKDNQLIVLDIPLLYEKNYEKMVDAVMVVYVDPATQKKRLMLREEQLSETDAMNRIQAQMPLKEKAKKADILINNNQTVKETISQVNNWLNKACGFDFKSEKNS